MENLEEYATLSDYPLIKHFIKGIYHLGPLKPKYSCIWDADILLRYWKHDVDNFHLNLLELSTKIAILFVLFQGLKHNCKTFDIHVITMSSDIVIFYRSELSKHDRLWRKIVKFNYKEKQTKWMLLIHIWNVGQSAMLFIQNFDVPL